MTFLDFSLDVLCFRQYVLAIAHMETTELTSLNIRQPWYLLFISSTIDHCLIIYPRHYVLIKSSLIKILFSLAAQLHKTHSQHVFFVIFLYMYIAHNLITIGNLNTHCCLSFCGTILMFSKYYVLKSLLKKILPLTILFPQKKPTLFTMSSL